MDNSQNQNSKPRWGKPGKGRFTQALLANASKNADDSSVSPGTIQRLINPMRSRLGLPALRMEPLESIAPSDSESADASALEQQVPINVPQVQTVQQQAGAEKPEDVSLPDENKNPTANKILNDSFLMDTLPYESFNLSRGGAFEDITNSSVRIPQSIQEDTKSFLIPQGQSILLKEKGRETFQTPLLSKIAFKSNLSSSKNVSSYSTAPNHVNDSQMSQDSFLANRKYNRNPRPEDEEFQIHADFSKISLLCPERSRLSVASPSFHEGGLGTHFMTSSILSVPEKVDEEGVEFSGKLEALPDDYSFLSTHGHQEKPSEMKTPLNHLKSSNVSGSVAATAAYFSKKSHQKPSNDLDKSEKCFKKADGRKHGSSSDKKTKKNSKRKSSGWKFSSESVQGKEYLLIKQLGKGGSGEVSLVLEKETRQLYALKIVNLTGINDHFVKECINEVEMLEGLKDSDLVVHIFAWEVNKTDQTLKIVMEHGQCDLNSSIRTISSSVLKVKYVWETMLTIVDTIHKRGVVHSDLKPANFIWVGDKLKIIDFGIASRLQQDQTSIAVGNPKGTINFMSPESVTADINGRAKVGPKSDVWSLGCILYLILFGSTPFQHISNTHLKLRAISEGKVEFSNLPFVNDALNPFRKEFESILSACFQPDYRHRKSCQELLLSLQRF